MAEASDVFGILRQNLIDAGCGEEAVACCLEYAERGEWGRLLPTLTKQKAALLRAVHETEKQIDCLDYLVYQINRQFEGGKI
ncbi:MAG: hypothetical protein PHI27_10640 [Eubacteriales bacterium]|nr:hypothetical protein [Eubacteriales bacterium]MDD3882698.1 hypothetical protein [Eubacteriales bacterium]MDD4512730.1 hypothetical protein [Eubacteriales bacterium]